LLFAVEDASALRQRKAPRHHGRRRQPSFDPSSDTFSRESSGGSVRGIAASERDPEQ
jgi:hypothetical protein